MNRSDLRKTEKRTESSASHEDLLCMVGQHNDRDAFIALFEYFAPRVKSFLMRGGMAEQTADELAQETMLAVWEKAHSYDPDRAKASTWIFTVARNKKIDFMRKSGRAEFLDFDAFNLEDDKAGPAQNMNSAQEEDILADALKSLPEDQRLLIEKSFYEGKSHGEIAKETGIALGTVKSRIRLALEKLRGKSSVKELQ